MLRSETRTMVQEPVQGSASAGKGPLRSGFHDDPEMIGIVVIFLEELPSRMRDLEVWFAAGDLERFHRLVHQLKGAGGGYGFPLSSEQAELLLRLLEQGEDEWTRRSHAAHEGLMDTLRRAHAFRADLQA
ncbi:MAG: Hpt domain-containing protein [Planctomycetaceae bacterium]